MTTAYTPNNSYMLPTASGGGLVTFAIGVGNISGTSNSQVLLGSATGALSVGAMVYTLIKAHDRKALLYIVPTAAVKLHVKPLRGSDLTPTSTGAFDLVPGDFYHIVFEAVTALAPAALMVTFQPVFIDTIDSYIDTGSLKMMGSYAKFPAPTPSLRSITINNTMISNAVTYSFQELELTQGTNYIAMLDVLQPGAGTQTVSKTSLFGVGNNAIDIAFANDAYFIRIEATQSGTASFYVTLTVDGLGAPYPGNVMFTPAIAVTPELSASQPLAPLNVTPKALNTKFVNETIDTIKSYLSDVKLASSDMTDIKQKLAMQQHDIDKLIRMLMQLTASA